MALKDDSASFLERLPLGRNRPVLRYGAVLAICALCFVIRWVADPVMPAGYPFVTFFPGVILSTFLFGIAPGVLAAVLCGFASWYCFIPPTFSAKFSGGVMFAMAFYALVVLIDVALIDWLQRMNRRLAAERERSRKLAERGEVLFRELQHRVSNNLQVVSGLIALQKKSISDEAARAALDEASRRLGLIGRIHRQLYDPHGDQLHIRDFLDQLGPDLIDASGKPGICCQVLVEEDFALEPDAAVPMALIIAEAVSNALEHGFGDREQGCVEITAQRTTDGMLEVRVTDDGAGLPTGFSLEQTNSLGLKLAQALARQLGGSFDLFAGRVTTALLKLPQGDPA
ncbi:sensor histidine kinase [Rhizorhabdus sp. FW153]|uniref:sensor histidine kinase n=1 Tax=Rhizorhabdus sp. FW153 TaxID=3400216 RepID=UPI003CEC1695